ncbi:ATP-binding protein [Motilimonas cestriensis]|uniref:ATP-binding protein n=1 Tax=Motilimonas cestriensis TaxID=2742685 RepID=A0ABS8W8I3_9GAMM|nr:ATP-binding protein [Motilimonas cestriensis]
MYSYRVRNLRSFSDDPNSEYIEICPLTIFIGTNSCGKSSLLRTFPLLRQSIESHTSGPILWYGKYVDYGAFSEAKNKSSSSEIIFFDYKFDLRGDSSLSFSQNEDLSVDLSLGVTGIEKSTVFDSLTVKALGVEVSVKYNEDGAFNVYVNGEITDAILTVNNKKSQGFIPSISLLGWRGGAEGCDLGDVENSEDIELNYYELIDKYNYYQAISRDGVKRLYETLSSKLQGDYENFYDFEREFLNGFYFDGIESVSEFDSFSLLSKEELFNVQKELLVAYFPTFIDEVNHYFECYFQRVKYIAPLRSTAERFYRFQDLHIDEVDHTGSNLAMVLRNLSNHQMRLFKDWSLNNFGFEVYVPVSDSLHYEILINIDGQETNISDMGFGFSQILPIITSIWLTEYSKSNPLSIRGRIPITYVIEQPELHLHPKMQATLAKVFAKVAMFKRNIGSPINIIFETHSKTMIDALGDVVEEYGGRESINIVILEKENNITKVTQTGFDDEGDLLKWPIGFFSGR